MRIQILSILVVAYSSSVYGFGHRWSWDAELGKDVDWSLFELGSQMLPGNRKVVLLSAFFQ